MAKCESFVNRHLRTVQNIKIW